MDDRTILWNRRFLEFFREHEGHVQRGEPYADNLRRSTAAGCHLRNCRTWNATSPKASSGIGRHRAQLEPFDFDHGGFRLRASFGFRQVDGDLSGGLACAAQCVCGRNVVSTSDP